MTTPAYLNIQEQLRELDEIKKPTELAILRISEPIASSVDANNSDGYSLSKRASDISVDGLDNPTPASLEADLTHYKELFSKLRFSYLEQVTKEKFLRAIVGDPPVVVGHNDNVELERELAQTKEELRARKEDVRLLVEEMGKKGRDLAARYTNVQLQTTRLSELPPSITNLESTIAQMRASQPHSLESTSSAPSQKLPLDATLRLLADRDAELINVNRSLASTETARMRKTRESEALEREISLLEKRRNEVVAQAKEAQRRKLEGESDRLEQEGRWYTAADQLLKGLV
ncbi:hypothetical protein FQN57_006472 [Myotisia sp. PD_48]|nr:hypothetical protein FQN57_006472 [Myotisia sp. PD_48]